ncbi:MAG TPA: TadE family protein [Candidatus Binatia bacterium]|nr:TadE family protein [Candidatus Binatia bacterium]
MPRADAASPHGERGQALLELALVVTILVLLFMAIFQFAYVLESQNGLTNAVREAARRVAATTTANPAWTGPGSLQTWVQGQLCGTYVTVCGDNPANRGLLAENVQGFDGSKLWTTVPDVSFCEYPVGSQVEYQVEVSLTYKHPLFFGLMAFATDLTDGSPNGFWDLSTSAQMRMENIDNTAPGFNPPGSTC